MSREPTISSKTTFEGRAFNVRVDNIRMPDGRETTREIVEHAPCVVIIPIDKDDNILLVQQYRKAVEKELLEIPAGGIDGNETPEQATIREMQEETGFIPARLIKLGGFYSSPGFCTEYLHCFLATELTPSRLFAEDTDEIKLVKVPAKEIPVLLASGKVEDSKTFAGLHLYLEWRKKNT
ncbi:MAG TPA: NUDIX hydrolase [Dehalococcoidales bacterium]|nr:NUDIX hydrolase [Dehalococcoidales bacterium]